MFREITRDFPTTIFPRFIIIKVHNKPQNAITLTDGNSQLVLDVENVIGLAKTGRALGFKGKFLIWSKNQKNSTDLS